MIDSDLKKKIGENIEQFNSMLFSLDSSIKENSTEFSELKHNFPEDLFDETTKNINLGYDTIINDQMENIKGTISNIIDFWKKFRDFSLGLEYTELFHKIKSSKNLIMKNLKNYGLSFLDSNKSPVQVIKAVNPVKSIENLNWINICENLRKNQRFLELKDPLNNYIRNYLDKKFNEEIKNAKLKYGNLSKDDVTDYRNEFYKSRLNFDEFWIKNKKPSKMIENNSELPSIIDIANKKQTEKTIGFDNYEAYLNSDDRQLARMKRAGIYNLEKKKNRRVRKPKKSKK
jgi:hypothetical protein